MGGAQITLFLTTHTLLYHSFPPYTWREGVLLSEKGRIAAHLQLISPLWRIAALQVVLVVDSASGRGWCRGRSSAGTTQQCSGLLVNRQRTCAGLTVRCW